MSQNVVRNGDTPTSHAAASRHAKTSSQIYVLSADGSKLFLLDPTAPEEHEHPPAYDTLTSPTPSAPANTVSPHSAPWDLGDEDDNGAGPSSPRPVSVRIHDLPSFRSSASLSVPRQERAVSGRNRANTTDAARPSSGTFRRTISAGGVPRRAGMGLRSRSYGSPNADIGDSEMRTGFAETSPLLGERGVKRRGMIRSIICGEVEKGDEDETWKAGWKRYWRPIGNKSYWRSVLHLVVLNFPFALLVWPFLFAGTVAGTALLITLPIGAAVWWLTLILARTAAKLEIIMQTHHHLPRQPGSALYHPIFHRPAPIPTDLMAEDGSEIIWEKGFIKCSYAMFCDHYSYSSLSYFLLSKPLLTLFSTIGIIILGSISLATLIGIPIYLRAMKRWGMWQAVYAVENL